MPFNVLVLCTGNSARSILGEMLFNHLGGGRIMAWSAGSKPGGTVNPVALETSRSKSWDEFAAPGAPEFDFIFTVCDSAAGETCPVWIGHPMTAHWGIEDPAAVEGVGQRDAFLQALRYLTNRISLFLTLPHASIDEMAMKQKLKEIGKAEGASSGASA